MMEGMSETISERRMAENEVFFRTHNEEAIKGFEDLEALAKEHGHDSFIDHSDDPLHFYCECSSASCRQRILVAPSYYIKIHKKRDCFIVLPGHQNPNIEKVVSVEEAFIIIQKHKKPPHTAGTLSAS